MPIDFTKADAEMEAGYPHLEIDSVQDAIHGIIVNWVCPYIGFGQLHIWAGEDEKLHADTERMSNEFVSAVFREPVKQMVREG